MESPRGIGFFGAFGLLVEILIGAEIVVNPAVSRATAVSECGPFVSVAVFSEVEYGETVSSGPIAFPSTRKVTPPTATLSDAFAAMVMRPDTIAPAAG